jgi:small subunit ribosomal protein S20
MPHKNSAKKALRKSDKRRLLHRSQKSTLRTLLKKFDAALEGDVSAEEKQKLFSEVTKKLDQSAAKKLIHANKASRTKSRLAARLNNATS